MLSMILLAKTRKWRDALAIVHKKRWHGVPAQVKGPHKARVHVDRFVPCLRARSRMHEDGLDGCWLTLDQTAPAEHDLIIASLKIALHSPEDLRQRSVGSAALVLSAQHLHHLIRAVRATEKIPLAQVAPRMAPIL